MERRVVIKNALACAALSAIPFVSAGSLKENASSLSGKVDNEKAAAKGKCKITVLKRLFLEDLCKEYKYPYNYPCEVHKEGEVFYTDGWHKPDKLCFCAWLPIEKHCAVLANGGSFDGEKEYITCCNDGIRPVIFKIEAG